MQGEEGTSRAQFGVFLQLLGAAGKGKPSKQAQPPLEGGFGVVMDVRSIPGPSVGSAVVTGEIRALWSCGGWGSAGGAQEMFLTLDPMEWKCH